MIDAGDHDDFLNSLKSRKASPTIDDGRQCTGKLLAIIDDLGQRGGGNYHATIGCHHAASTISANVNGTGRLAIGR